MRLSEKCARFLTVPWRRAFASGGEGDAETVARQLSGGLCRTRTAEMFNVRPPLMGYWETRMAA